MADGLVELRVANLGVIEAVSVVFGPGMTAISGETGAGKTLVLTALDLLVGGRADPAMVGPYGTEAVVEGRFVLDGIEHVTQRVIPADGRSRAYLDGRLATAGTLAELGATLVEFHGQHANLVLAKAAAQRDALDQFAGVDLSPLQAIVERRADLVERRDSLGGDSRQRVREAELYRFQLDEISAAGITDPDEDNRLRREISLLADAESSRSAAAMAAELLGADGPADDALRRALAALGSTTAMEELAGQVTELAAGLVDVASSARRLAESIEDDPARLAALQERRSLLADLRRKYGETLADVLAFEADLGARLTEHDARDEIAAALDAELEELAAAERDAAAKIGEQRRAAAPRLAAAVTEHAKELALGSALVAVHVGSRDPGDEVEIRFSANPAATEPGPLGRVASGGELARVMLALRLVLSAGPATMVFDEVDAGVGGAAATAVGQALAGVAADRQVVVVTHLPQVAAWADQQVVLTKTDRGDAVSITAELLTPETRVVELSRMLSGSPDSTSAQVHAAELLDATNRSARGSRSAG